MMVSALARSAQSWRVRQTSRGLNAWTFRTSEDDDRWKHQAAQQSWSIIHHRSVPNPWRIAFIFWRSTLAVFTDVSTELRCRPKDNPPSLQKPDRLGLEPGMHTLLQLLSGEHFSMTGDLQRVRNGKEYVRKVSR